MKGMSLNRGTGGPVPLGQGQADWDSELAVQRPVEDGEAYLVVKRLGLRSPSEGYNMLNSAKRTFARLLNYEISEYEGDEAAQRELECLKAFLDRIADKKTTRTRGMAILKRIERKKREKPS